MFDFAKLEKWMRKQGGHLVAVFRGVYRRVTTAVTPHLRRKAALL